MAKDYMMSLLFLLLITHWTHSFSLPSLLYSSDNQLLDQQNSESQVSLIKRLRRWSKNVDHDEVEIPLNDTVESINNSDDITTVNSIVNSTSVNFETIELNTSIMENVGDVINSTVEIDSDRNITMKHPLLRQDFTELNQTTVSIIQEVLQANKTDMNEISLSSTLFNELIDVNQTVTNNESKSVTGQIDNLSNDFQSSSTAPQTTVDNRTKEFQSSTAPQTTVDNQTQGWTLSINEKTETISLNDSSTVTTSDEVIINSNITQKDAIIPNEEMYLNDTEIIFIEADQNSNETSFLSPKSVSIPICDRSCQCLKECSYGFELLNDTCLCNPPCKNYQCFGNDTCILTDKGEPLCQAENGTKHDRPNRCYQPRDAGYHAENMHYHNRWYYNPDQDTCHLFVYRGLGGNENNFQTLNQCHLECITCAPLPDPGECLGHINMWYYNREANECREFAYSGCKGNENQFLKKEQCVDTCINRIFSL